jgi:catechol 2,3-dioxygenase-like lactoylglutathione lyase family enzyme
MQARLSVITLGVVDVERSRQFYVTGLGWRASSSSSEQVVFIDAGTVVLALYPLDLLAEDATLTAPEPGFSGVTLAQNVRSKAEVDAVLEEAVRAGAELIKPAGDTFWGGYSGYFADPDGHPWEIAYNPHWGLDDSGRVQLPA